MTKSKIAMVYNNFLKMNVKMRHLQSFISNNEVLNLQESCPVYRTIRK